MYYDIVLKNGTLSDSNTIDIGINNGRINIIDKMPANEMKIARQTLDLEGKFLMPGFVDVHSHTDEACLNSSLTSKIFQGITTEVCGNCGGSAAPLLTETSYIKRKSLKVLEDNWYTSQRWRYFNEYFETIANSHCICNQLSFVGLWTIYDSSKNFQMIFQMAEECLKLGCVGISINQSSDSWKHFQNHQKLQLFGLIYKYNKILSIHLSSYSDQFVKSIDEIKEFLNKYPVKIVFSHMKFLGTKKQKNIEYFNEFLQTHCKSSTVKFDVYPYLSICTRLKNIINENGYRLNDFSKIHIFKYDLWIQINEGIINEANWKLLLDLYKENENLLVEAYGMLQREMECLIQNENCFIGTDYTSCAIDLLSQKMNPKRAFNSFPDAFNILRTLKNDVTSIISKFSGNPSRFFEIEKRGFIRNGYYADLVVLDINKINIDIQYVFINGKMNYKKDGICSL